MRPFFEESPGFSSQISDSDIIHSIISFDTIKDSSNENSKQLVTLPLELEYWKEFNTLISDQEVSSDSVLFSAVQRAEVELDSINEFNSSIDLDIEVQNSPLIVYDKYEDNYNSTAPFGFCTASNKQIQVSLDAIKRAKLLLEDDLSTKTIQSQNISSNNGYEEQSNFTASFTTATNKPITITQESLYIADNLLNDQKEDIFSKLKTENLVEPNTHITSAPSTASSLNRDFKMPPKPSNNITQTKILSRLVAVKKPDFSR